MTAEDERSTASLRPPDLPIARPPGSRRFLRIAVLAVVQGPRLETAAEVRRLAGDGCDLVGMTGMPEAALARELALPYAALCMTVNAAAGLTGQAIDIDEIRRVIAHEVELVVRVLAQAIPALENYSSTAPSS
jgi:5'-methylthioinosine phosphorylase